MGTPCIIGKVNKDKTTRAIYCHYDGHLSNMGKILVNYYNKEEDIDKLLDLGDLSYIGIVPKSSPKLWDFPFTNEKPYNSYCRAYRDREGEKDIDAKIYKSPSEAITQYYNYFFIDGKWYCRLGNNEKTIIDVESDKELRREE